MLKVNKLADQIAGRKPNLTLDGRDPLDINLDDPAVIHQAPTDGGVAFSQSDIDRMIDQKVKEARAQFERKLELMTEGAKRNRTVAALQQQIAAAVGDDQATLSYRAALQELALEAHSDDARPAAELLEAATKLAHARVDALAKQGGDGSGDMEQIADGVDALENPYFDMGRFFTSLSRDIEAQGRNFTLERIGRRHSGPELEYIKDRIDGPDQAFMERVMPQVTRSRRDAAAPIAIPFPVSAVAARVPMTRDVALAETYVESVVDGKQRREPTFRGDLLVPFFRPTLVLRGLGVPMLVISNDQTLPRLTGSLEAGWLAENAEIADGNLTFVSATTSPKRIGVRDDISWMNLAAANAQLPITPLVTMEMTRALSMAEEQSVFAGSGADGQPIGVLSSTGVNTEVVAGNAPTYADILNIINALQDANIPDMDARFVCTSSIRKHLMQILRFPGSAGGANRALYEGTRQSMMGGAGAMGPSGYIVEVPAWITNNLPRALGAANNEHAMLYGSWQYFYQFQYSMAFLTIDDISQAATGQTRITVNKFCDNFMRFPAAFVKSMWIPQ